MRMKKLELKEKLIILQSIKELLLEWYNNENKSAERTIQELIDLCMTSNRSEWLI